MNVYILLDRSGSMASIWAETIKSINVYAEALVDAKIYLASFDSTSYDVLRPLGAWKPLMENESYARGSTPLYDATGKLLAKVWSDNPDKAIVVIVTDGAENCSSEYSLQAIKDKLKEAEERKYQVIFLGANFKDIDIQTSTLGMTKTRSAYVMPEYFSDTMKSLASKSQIYASAAVATMSVSDVNAIMDYTDDEKAFYSGQMITDNGATGANVALQEVKVLKTRNKKSK